MHMFQIFGARNPMRKEMTIMIFRHVREFMLRFIVPTAPQLAKKLHKTIYNLKAVLLPFKIHMKRGCRQMLWQPDLCVIVGVKARATSDRSTALSVIDLTR